jgi:hypothetical protein
MTNLLHFFTQNKITHRETRNVKAIGIGFGGRLVNIATQFIATRILIEYLHGQEVYGIFITIISVISRIQLTNFGFGLGLQNTLIDAVAKKDIDRQKKMIRSTQYSLILICTVSSIIWTTKQFVKYQDWAKVLNAAHSPYSQWISLSVYIAGLIAIFTVLTRYFSPIYSANQELYRIGYRSLGGNY